MQACVCVCACMYISVYAGMFVCVSHVYMCIVSLSEMWVSANQCMFLSTEVVKIYFILWLLLNP